MDHAAIQLEHYRFSVKHHFWRQTQTQFMNREKMITLDQQERCNGDMMSTSVIKNSRASSPTIFSKNFASGSILSISKNYLTQFILHSRKNCYEYTTLGC